jgi:hypothetical protein
MSMNPDPDAPKAESDDFVLELDAEVEEDHCAICLQTIVDRALIPECSHEFCFECMMIWSGKKFIEFAAILYSDATVSQYLSKKNSQKYAHTIEQSRRCPLCSQTIGDYLIHHIRSTYDYQKHFLPPLRTSPRLLSRIDGPVLLLWHADVVNVCGVGAIALRRMRPMHYSARSVGAGGYIRHKLYAKVSSQTHSLCSAKKGELTFHLNRGLDPHPLPPFPQHVASNKYTRYRPYPTPSHSFRHRRTSSVG